MADTIFLDRIDAAPVLSDVFQPPFASWLAVLVNSLNEDIQDIQNYFNLLTAISYTASEIASMQAASPAVLNDGVLLYDSTNNEYVGRINGSLVKFTTTAYP
jgi:hypothetical protein